MKVHVIYTHAGRWWTAEAPFLRGAYSQGLTRASARRNLFSAIHDLLATYRAEGVEPPVSSVEVQVTVEDVR